MALRTWEYDREDWPPTFGRLWLWTMFSERANHARVVATAQEIGATDVIVLINDSPASQPQFGFRPNREMSLELAEKIRDAGMRYHVSTWLDPKAAYVQAAATELRTYVKESGAWSVCLDAEGEWRKRISNHVDFVAETVDPAFKGFPVPIGVTSFAGLPAEVAPLLAWAVEKHDGYGQPQAYGVDTGAAWQQAASVKPDKIASIAWRTWSPFTDRLVALVGAFGNAHAGWTQASQLEAQLLRSEYEGFPEAGVWVEESIVGSSATAKARREVLAEVVKTGKSTAVGGPSLVKPLLIGSGVVVAGALTRRWWAPALGRLWRSVRGA